MDRVNYEQVDMATQLSGQARNCARQGSHMNWYWPLLFSLFVFLSWSAYPQGKQKTHARHTHRGIAIIQCSRTSPEKEREEKEMNIPFVSWAMGSKYEESKSTELKEAIDMNTKNVMWNACTFVIRIGKMNSMVTERQHFSYSLLTRPHSPMFY
jgi:hypothetical protein